MISANEVVNYFLYGAPVKPEKLDDDALIRPNNATSTYFPADTYEDMTTGPGRFANPTFLNLVKTFFFPDAGSVSEGLAAGDYKKADLINRIDSKADWGLQLFQVFYDDGQDNYLERAFVWNSTAFKISDDAVFHVDADGSRWIDKFGVVVKQRFLLAARASLAPEGSYAKLGLTVRP